MKVTYYGHSAFGLEHGGVRLLIDPFFTDNPNAPLKAADVKADYILVTHAHSDHLGDTVAIAQINKATVIAPNETGLIAEQLGSPAVHRMHIGGAHRFPFGRVKLTAAMHGSVYSLGDTLVSGGNPCGFLVTLGEITVYHAGDTGLFGDMRLIGEMNRIDLALLPIGDNFTMGIDDAVKAVEFLNAGLAVPMHYNTFPLIQADPHEFVRKVESIGKKALVMAPGETLEL